MSATPVGNPDTRKLELVRQLGLVDQVLREQAPVLGKLAKD